MAPPAQAIQPGLAGMDLADLDGFTQGDISMEMFENTRGDRPMPPPDGARNVGVLLVYPEVWEEFPTPDPSGKKGQFITAARYYVKDRTKARPDGTPAREYVKMRLSVVIANDAGQVVRRLEREDISTLPDERSQSVSMADFAKAIAQTKGDNLDSLLPQWNPATPHGIKNMVGYIMGYMIPMMASTGGPVPILATVRTSWIPKDKYETEASLLAAHPRLKERGAKEIAYALANGVDNWKGAIRGLDQLLKLSGGEPYPSTLRLNNTDRTGYTSVEIGRWGKG